MKYDIDEINRLKDEGLNWQEIGCRMIEGDASAYLKGERIRHSWKAAMKHVNKVTKDKIAKLSKGVYTSEKVFQNRLNPMSPEELLKSHGFSSDDWDVLESTASVRGENTTSRVKVRPKPYRDVSDVQMHDAVVAALLSLPPIEVPHYTLEPYTTDEGKTAVLPLFDVHLGRRYDMDGEHFDEKNTEKDVIEATELFIQQVVDWHVGNVILGIGQDFLNADTVSGTTTAGTRQDNSLPWHEMFANGLVLLVNVVDALRRVAKVKVVYTEGNHDLVLGFCLAKALKEHYADCEGVEIDAGAKPRKYVVLGNTLIGFSHGKEEAKMDSVMQNEVPRLWGITSHRYWLLGHLHHLEMDEAGGVTTIRIPSMIFPDEWTERKGFCSERRAMGMLFDKTRGIEQICLMQRE